MIKKILAIFFVFSTSVFMAVTMPVQEKPPETLVTTSWTAAFAEAAGVTDLKILAPYELAHPAEYVLRPSDIEAVRGARLIIYAGYETMVARLKGIAAGRSIELLQIGTDYSLRTIEESVRAISLQAGTEETASRSIREIRLLYAGWKEELERRGMKGAAVLVHAFQKPLAEELGFTVEGIFGPGPMEASQIARLSQKSVRLIIDNRHNEAGRPLVQTIPTARYVSLLNFPGSEDTRSLMDVLRFNRGQFETSEQ
jgi:zinc transport system substrate-binding protein